jgi:hypothetical protein
MILRVPESGVDHTLPEIERVRTATAEDVASMAALETDVSGISREKDYRFAIDNRHGIWETQVIVGGRGGIDGYMISAKHPALRMLGPCVTRTEKQAAALIACALRRYCGQEVVFLVPVHCEGLVRQMYAWGARNYELHFCQVRGDYQPLAGVNMPTFLLETG